MTKIRRGHLAGLLLFCLLLVNTLALAQSTKQNFPGLPNFHEVASGIYRGGAPTAEGLKTLKALNVQTIIDLRIERAAQAEKQAAQKLGFNWLHLPMGREAPTKQQVEDFLAALASSQEAPVFVHCQHGADRTGCMIGIYRVQVQGWSFSQAWTEMRKYGFKTFLSELKAAVHARARIK
jgi:protein tyrosine/serine phosphatase